MILGISSSGRPNGNSHHLLQLTLSAAREAGHDTELVQLPELAFKGCVGCAACRSGADACMLDDGLTAVLEKTAAAEALVLAAPIYYGYPNGLFKSYLDRWYSFRDGERKLRLPTGRPAALILTQGHPDPDGYPWTVQSLRKVLSAYGCEPQVMVAAGVEDAWAARSHVELEAQARQLGAALLSPAPTSTG